MKRYITNLLITFCIIFTALVLIYCFTFGTMPIYILQAIMFNSFFQAPWPSCYTQNKRTAINGFFFNKFYISSLWCVWLWPPSLLWAVKSAPFRLSWISLWSWLYSLWSSTYCIKRSSNRWGNQRSFTATKETNNILICILGLNIDMLGRFHCDFCMIPLLWH